ncbi:hypothetical protein HBA55_06080 [Pseudomaricurvus alkylphenolicus]|uniref:hypothetical protein n=1 Tax=Pseudomaricurvus alkylphenolicus TaxID=1306991 RepID=UPI0014200086|nr:hypothetical protein [Pseudomaricurvus alkylphenolicus]NIB39144.1 hypothetical protein [Pseudomaricurvus alkylphenolicus]
MTPELQGVQPALKFNPQLIAAPKKQAPKRESEPEKASKEDFSAMRYPLEKDAIEYSVELGYN